MKKLALLLVISSACAIHSASANLLVNGDFNSGNTGFGSDYFYTSVNTAAGEYYVLSDDASTWNGGFAAVVGYGGSGNYLVANGSTSTSESPWFQTINNPSVTLTTNTNSPTYYRFEAQVAGLVDPNGAAEPNLSFEISVDGGAWNRFVNTPPSLGWGPWTLVYADTYLTAAPTSLSFRLRNQATDYNGNDFAIDSIYFGLTTSAPSYPANGISSSGVITQGLGAAPTTAVPEPGTWAAAALLIGGAGFARWRKRTKVS